MSRNLAQANCYFCGEEVVKEEAPRPVTREEVGAYWNLRDGYSFEGMICANAKCHICGAKYLAWIDLSACVGYGRPEGPNHDGTIRDLSFRSTFNDEPGNDDMPDFLIHKVVTIEKEPWPRCKKCGEKEVSDNYCPNCFDLGKNTLANEVKP